jgi:hypothetical protein
VPFDKAAGLFACCVVLDKSVNGLFPGTHASRLLHGTNAE